MPESRIQDDIARQQLLNAFLNPQLDTRGADYGTITQGSWLDFNPAVKGALEGLSEMVGIAPSQRVVQRLAEAQSPVLRPQGAFGWGDWGAGLAADTIQTGLAAADLAALAPIVGRRAATSLSNQIGAVGQSQPAPLWRWQMEDVLSAKLSGKGEPGQIAQTIEAFAKKPLPISGLR